MHSYIARNERARVIGSVKINFSPARDPPAEHFRTRSLKTCDKYICTPFHPLYSRAFHLFIKEHQILLRQYDDLGVEVQAMEFND